MKVVVTAGLLAMTALPGLAFERMMRTDCRAAIEQLSELMDDEPGKTQRLVEATRVTPQGWCEISGDGLDVEEFDTFEWRAEGITRWLRNGIPPTALELRIKGLDPDRMQNSSDTGRPHVDVSVTLRQVSKAGQVIVERAIMENEAGDILSVSGVFERLFLSSPSMMQVSAGSATFKAGLMSLTLSGIHENPFGFKASFDLQGDSQTQRDMALKMISSLPDGLVSDQSRAELVAFSGDLPQPVGTLEVMVNSERGLGLIQVGAAVAMSGYAMLMEEEAADQLEVMFDGLAIDADWTPSSHVAD